MHKDMNMNSMFLSLQKKLSTVGGVIPMQPRAAKLEKNPLQYQVK